MKRMLLVTATIMGSTVVAQAATSVTLYGIADGGIAYQSVNGTWNDAKYSASKTGMISGGQSGSRWGLKGTEDLGGGLKAVFQLENGFDLTNGTSTQGGRLFGRHATVGLASDDWGQLDLGRQSNIASKFGTPIVDPFDAGFTQAAAGTSFSAMNTARYDNMAMYQSPKMGGFQFGIGYSFAVNGEQSWKINGKPADDGKALTTGLRYQNGPFGTFVSYDQIKFDASGVNVKEWILGAAYDFGAVNVSAALGKTKDGWFFGRNFGPLSTGTYVMADGLDVNSYMVGLTAPLGNGLLRASWQMADARSGATASKTAAFVGENLDRQQVYSLGYTYDLSKRTNLYVYGSYAKHALFQDDLDATVAAVGIRHRF